MTYFELARRQYVHTDTSATTAATTISTAQAKGKSKLSRNIYVDAELNENELRSCRFSIGWQSNITITAYVIKLDLSG